MYSICSAASVYTLSSLVKKIHIFWILSSGDDDSIFSYCFLLLDLKVAYKCTHLGPERALCDQSKINIKQQWTINVF